MNHCIKKLNEFSYTVIIGGGDSWLKQNGQGCPMEIDMVFQFSLSPNMHETKINSVISMFQSLNGAWSRFSQSNRFSVGLIL
jgi:hypothetical protein